jgi:thioredoxin reductase
LTGRTPNIPEGGTVVVVGDSGTAGWAAQEAQRTGRTAIIVARDTSLSRVPDHVRQDLEAHKVRIVGGVVSSVELDGDRVVVGVASSDSEAPRVLLHADGMSTAIGQDPVLPRGFENLRFRMVKRTVNGKERVVALEAYEPMTGRATGMLVQGAAMTSDPFKKGAVAVDDREAFVEALRRQANDEAVPEKSRGVEPSIHQSAINVPLSNEKQP